MLQNWSLKHLYHQLLECSLKKLRDISAERLFNRKISALMARDIKIKGPIMHTNIHFAHTHTNLVNKHLKVQQFSIQKSGKSKVILFSPVYLYYNKVINYILFLK